MLKGFEERKKSLLDAYDDLYKEGLVKEKSKVDEWKKQLEKEEFIVSFCGQIKAGKSSLLNALIFRKPVLPFKITPHTAKLTIIKFGDTPSFTASFYTEEEWNKLIKELKKQKEKDSLSYFDKYMKDEINQRITNFGIYPDNFLGKEEKNLDLRELNDFVGADGKYTPFVKEVHIYYPNSVLKNLTIVDTPGTNDPNPFRSRETLKWIKNSNAVVYVVYAGQPFTETDIQFIDTYLITVPSNLIVFAVNKIDTIGNIDELKSWVEEVKKDDRLRRRKIMADSKSIAYVSALGGLIGRMLEDCKNEGIEPDDCIPDELVEKTEELYSKGFTKESEHKLSELEKIIDEKLIQTKGKSVLCSHKKRIEGIIKDNIRKLKTELGNSEENLKIFQGDIDKIDQKRKEIELEKKKLIKLEEDLGKKVKELGNKILILFSREFKNIVKKQRKIFEFNLKNLKNSKVIDYDSIPLEAVYSFKESIEEILSIDRNREFLESVLEKVRVDIYGFYNLIIEQDFVPSDIVKIIPVNTIIVDIFKSLQDEVEKETNHMYKLIEKIKDEKTHTFWFIPWRDKGNRNEVISHIKTIAFENFQEIEKSIYNALEENIQSLLEYSYGEIFNIIKERIEGKNQAINSLADNFRNKESMINEYKARIKKLKEKLLEMEELKENIISKISFYEC